ncbi:PA1571 family protein [Isoalcanivorax beigongshangi]|uniref:PA1571 family protein n=1 Tax=Isoalcanivorax beigongshangi TaxID=3238810 RepID=A0ABV4AHD6_9GAMM
MNTSIRTQNSAGNQDFHGAALIDAQGREIPITEEMVQRACDRLEQAWSYPLSTAHPAN